MKFWICALLFVLLDALSYISVPREIRHNLWWPIVPGGGYILAIEYHFGNKMKAPNGC